MADHMNVFEPYVRKDAHHEDALTRAFLIVLRGVPLAHAAWLALVDRAHRQNRGAGLPAMHELGEPDVVTQITAVPDEIERLVSVIQTDELFVREADAGRSMRRQVLDGLVLYGSALAVVIENKPLRGNIWEEQLDVNVSAGVDHDPRVACVTWKEIVGAWGGLVVAGHLGRAEQLLVDDFLAYVETHFPRLRPYSTVRLCGGDRERLTRRCHALLADVAGGSRVAYHRGWGWFIDLPDGQSAKKVALFPVVSGESASLVLEIDPGDTMGQAKLLYRDVRWEEVDALLGEPKWVAWPNFHLMFMATGFFRIGGALPLREYFLHWRGNPGEICRWRREEFEHAFEALVRVGIVTARDREHFDRGLVNTRRAHADVAPGLTVQWRLPLAEAVDLDDRGLLATEIRRVIERAASVFRLRSSSG